MTILQRKTNKEDLIINLALFIIYFIALYPLTKVWLNVGDDIDLYINTSRELSYKIVDYWIYEHGRFYLTFMRYVYTVPYLVDNHLYFSLMLILPIALCFVLFTRLIKRVFNNYSITILSALLFAALFQINGFHSATTAYPFFFNFGFSLILISLHLFISFYEKKKKRFLYFSALLMLMGTLFYEAFMFYYIVFLMIAIWKNNLLKVRTKANLIKTLKELLPFIIGGTLYLIVYFVFQIFYPPLYNGAFVAKNITLWGVLKTAFAMSSFSIPFKSYLQTGHILINRSMSIDGVFSLLRIDLLLIFQGLIVCIIAFYVMQKYKAIKYIHLLWGFIAGVAFIFLPTIIISFTNRYYLSNLNNHVPTFYSYFGYILCIVMIIAAILNLVSFSKKLRIGFQITVTLLLFVVCILTQSMNKAICEDLQLSNFRFEMVEEVIEDSKLIDYTTKTPICFEEAGYTSSTIAKWTTWQYFSWQYYFIKVTSKVNNFFNLYEDLYTKYHNLDTLTWVCFFRQTYKTQDALMYFSSQKGSSLPPKQKDILSNKIVALYHSPIKTFNVSIVTLSQDDTVYLNNMPMNKIGNYHNLNISFVPLKNKNSSSFSIRGNNLVAQTLTISNIPSSNEFHKTKYISEVNRKAYIENIILDIRSSSGWMQDVTRKAKERNRTIKQTLKDEATWYYDNVVLKKEDSIQ
jgi:hypothetical protein